MEIRKATTLFFFFLTCLFGVSVVVFCNKQYGVVVFSAREARAVNLLVEKRDRYPK